MEKIAFIGLGVMGKPMAVNLTKAGYPLTATSRSERSRQAGRDAGVNVVDAVSALGDADIVVTMVPDAPDVEAVLWGEGGFLVGEVSPTTIIDMSTIAPRAAREFAERAALDGHTFIDAPVSGGEQGAVEGTLSIMVGGSDATVEAVRPVLEVMGRSIVHVGDTGAGQVVKAANQLVVAGNLQLIAEAIAIATAHGIDAGLALDVIGAGLGGSTTLERKRAAMLAGDFTPGFRLALHHKDLGIAAQAARERDVVLPASAVVAQLVQAMVARGDGELDHSALVTLTRELGGRA